MGAPHGAVCESDTRRRRKRKDICCPSPPSRPGQSLKVTVFGAEKLPRVKGGLIKSNVPDTYVTFDTASHMDKKPPRARTSRIEGQFVKWDQNCKFWFESKNAISMTFVVYDYIRGSDDTELGRATVIVQAGKDQPPVPLMLEGDLVRSTGAKLFINFEWRNTQTSSDSGLGITFFMFLFLLVCCGVGVVGAFIARGALEPPQEPPDIREIQLKAGPQEDFGLDAPRSSTAGPLPGPPLSQSPDAALWDASVVSKLSNIQAEPQGQVVQLQVDVLRPGSQPQSSRSLHPQSSRPQSEGYAQGYRY